jgi:hypothetical protein
MADLAVIVPTRGRPDAAEDLIRAFDDTCTADTDLVFAVDLDDPSREKYAWTAGRAHPRVSVVAADTHTMVEALNDAATLHARLAYAVGFMGDDHRPRVKGWDQRYLDALRELGTGIVYGDDLLQGEKLPTQCAMTSDIVRALGHMAPPPLRHMYVDNYWLDLGRACGCVRYLPDVVVEHMHPVAGKSEWTEGHKRVNDRAVYAADESAYRRYLVSEFPADVAKVRALHHSGSAA